MLTYRFLKCLTALFLGCLLNLQAQAVVVTGTATDIADAIPGTDRWQITYRIAGVLPTNYAVTLMFPTAGFGDLAMASLPPASLDVALTPGDPVGGFDGLLILTALSDFGVADFADYSIFFTKLSTLPFGPQFYEVTDANFELSEGGSLAIAVTTPTNTVPEPASWMLLGLGIAIMMCRSPRARFRRRPNL